MICCLDFRIEPFTKMAALAEWIRTGLWQLGEPFQYQGKVYYKIDRENPPHNVTVDDEEGEVVVQMHAFLHDCEAGGCRIYVNGAVVWFIVSLSPGTCLLKQGDSLFHCCQTCVFSRKLESCEKRSKTVLLQC